MEWLRESEYLLNIPKTKRGWATLERICEAAEREFSEKGFSNTSVVDITKSADVGAGTFYLYFDSKLDIYKYLLKSYHHDIRKNIREHVKDLPTREEQERAGLRYWFDYVDKNRFVFNIAWESFFIDKAIFDEYYSTFGESYARNLEVAQENGEVLDMDLEVLSFILMAITNFLAVHWVVFKKKNHYDFITDETMKLLRHGMFTSYGLVEEDADQSEKHHNLTTKAIESTTKKSAPSKESSVKKLKTATKTSEQIKKEKASNITTKKSTPKGEKVVPAQKSKPSTSSTKSTKETNSTKTPEKPATKKASSVSGKNIKSAPRKKLSLKK